MCLCDQKKQGWPNRWSQTSFHWSHPAQTVSILLPLRLLVASFSYQQASWGYQCSQGLLSCCNSSVDVHCVGACLTPAADENEVAMRSLVSMRACHARCLFWYMRDAPFDIARYHFWYMRARHARLYPSSSRTTSGTFWRPRVHTRMRALINNVRASRHHHQQQHQQQTPTRTNNITTNVINDGNTAKIYSHFTKELLSLLQIE